MLYYRRFPQKQEGTPMNAIFDKMILFILCASVFLTQVNSIYVVVPIIFVIILASLGSYLDSDRISFGIFIGYIALSMLYPESAYFLPVFAYSIFSTRLQWVALLTVLPVSIFFYRSQSLVGLLLFLFVLLAWLLRIRTTDIDQKNIKYKMLRDAVTEKQMQLEAANRTLLEKQDYDVHLATLNERNRISSELHDSIGHVLTSSLLQTGAMLATCTDAATCESLSVLQQSLSSGMDEVRASIHNLHEESIDLYEEIRARIQEFFFCPVILKCNLVEQPDKNIRYALMSILKESLSNVARHSNATEVTVTLHEHPALYQLIIRDNGSDQGPAGEFELHESDGMGLPGIRQRVEKLGGNVVFRRNHGFEVFVSVPKEGV